MNIPQLNLLDDLFKELAPAWRRAWHELEQSQTAENRDTEAADFIKELQDFAVAKLQATGTPVVTDTTADTPDTYWLVDAVYGWTNFGRVLQPALASFVLVKDGQTDFVTLQDFMTNTSYSAANGKGLVGKWRGRMTGPKAVENALIHVPHGELGLMQKLEAAGANLRVNGNPAMAMVDLALGRVDALVAEDLTTSSQKIIELFTQESGGITITLPNNGLIACSHALSDALTKALK